MTNLKLNVGKPVFEPFYGLVKPRAPLFNIGGTDYRQLTPKRPMVIRKGYCVKSCFYFRGTKTCMGVQCYWPKVGSCSLYDKLYARTKGGKIAAIKTNRIKAIRARRAKNKKELAKAWRAA